MLRINKNKMYNLIFMRIIPLIIASQTAQAEAFNTGDLPQGCSFTEKSEQVFSSSLNIATSSAKWSDIGGTPRTILNFGVQCSNTLASPVTMQSQIAGNVNWLGPARDILATNIPGIGVRLFAELTTVGGQCSGAGTLSFNNPARCSLQAQGSEIRSFNYVIKAQLIKTGNATPVQRQSVLHAENGSVSVVLNGTGQSSIDIFNSGLVAPTLITPASCEIMTDKNQSVSFGAVNRPDVQTETTVGQPQSTRIEVACSPKRAEGNLYNVNIKFTAGKLHPNDGYALSTNIDDIIVRFSSGKDNSSWIKFGDTIPLNYNSSLSGDKSHFDETFYWSLRYLPQKKNGQTGNFEAISTYTITVQ
ncbi:fimbrial protein [Pantoea sp. SGAir0175]